MANNNLSLFSKTVPLLDEAYKLASLTSVLDGDAEMMRAGANADEIIVPIMDMSGMTNYSRNVGYGAEGAVTMTNATYECTYNRGRMFTVDTLDNAETAGLAFGRLAGEFIRTKVAPEIDAWRIAEYCQKENIGAAEPAELTTGEEVLAALRAASNAMDEAEVLPTERYLFIVPSLIALVEDLDSYRSRSVISRFQQIIQVPQTRMYTEITLAGSGNGGYAQGAEGKNLNFLVAHKPAVIQYNKHVAPKVIAPEQNPTADAWKFGYRVCGIADVYENKRAGIYCHSAAA